MALLLVAVLLSAYFLSQFGFVNYVTGGAIRTTFGFDYRRMEISSNPSVEVAFSWAYIQEQESFSADWLSKYAGDSSIVYADSAASIHELVSCALIPAKSDTAFNQRNNTRARSVCILGQLECCKRHNTYFNRGFQYFRNFLFSK